MNPAMCRPGLVRDIVQCCRLARAPAAVDAALQCVIQMTASAALQVSILLKPPALSILLDRPAPQALPAISHCWLEHHVIQTQPVVSTACVAGSVTF